MAWFYNMRLTQKLLLAFGALLLIVMLFLWRKIQP